MSQSIKSILSVTLLVLVALSNLTIGMAEKNCTWEQKADFSIGRSYFASAQVNGKIYVIGGKSTDNNWSKSVEEYDSSTNTWTHKANLQQGRSFFEAVVYNDKIYVFGGLGGVSNRLNTVEMYDPNTNTWVSKSNMPVKRSTYKAVLANDKIYLFGGSNENGNVMQIDVYDPNTNTWETKSNIPFFRSGFTLNTLDKKIYLVGGAKENEQDLGHVDVYDAEKETWSSLNRLSIYRETVNDSIFYKGKIYTIINKDVKSTNTLASFDIDSNTWTYNAFDPHYCSYGHYKLSIIDDKMYVTGGREYNITNDQDNNFSTRMVTVDLSKLSVSSPTNLTATPANAQITLNWNAVDGAESYNVKRSTTQGGPYTTIANNVTTTTYVDTNVTNGTTYYYVVTAVKAGSESENSNEASATPVAPVINRALLHITMQNGFIKEYDMAMTEVESFISWYNSTSGSNLYTINKFNNIGPFLNRKDYLVKDKVMYFEVLEYESN